MNAFLRFHALLLTILTPVLALLTSFGSLAAADDKPVPVPDVKQWEQDVRKGLEKDDKLKALAAKYPLILLHSRRLYCRGDYKQSAYSFIYETFKEKDHYNDVQLLFDNGGYKKPKPMFQANMLVPQQNLVVDLGQVDFEKNPDPTKISIDQPNVNPCDTEAVEGHVYLERVRDTHQGNNFYVLFQVVAVDKDVRYMAFVWRKLPGGKVVKYTPDKPVPEPPLQQWEQEVRKQLEKDKNDKDKEDEQKLKTLAAKYPLILLCSRNLYDDAAEGHKHASYSFAYESFRVLEHTPRAQILFEGGDSKVFSFNLQVGQQNLIVDLGKADFEKNPEPTKINIDQPGVLSSYTLAAAGHVYLERVRDDIVGNNFYVLFQVVAVDPDNRYMAFLWRKLSGGKVVKP